MRTLQVATSFGLTVLVRGHRGWQSLRLGKICFAMTVGKFWEFCRFLMSPDGCYIFRFSQSRYSSAWSKFVLSADKFCDHCRLEISMSRMKRQSSG